MNNNKELIQLDIIMSFLNKRHAFFKEQCAKKKFQKSAQADQHKIFRDLISQIAIVCGVIGAPQTATFKESGSIYALKHLYSKSDQVQTPKFQSPAGTIDESIPNSYTMQPKTIIQAQMNGSPQSIGVLKISKAV